MDLTCPFLGTLDKQEQRGLSALLRRRHGEGYVCGAELLGEIRDFGLDVVLGWNLVRSYVRGPWNKNHNWD